MKTSTDTLFNQMPDAKLISVTEAVKEFRIGRNTIYRLIHSEAFDAIRVGSQWRIFLQSIRDFVDKGGEWHYERNN